MHPRRGFVPAGIFLCPNSFDHFEVSIVPEPSTFAILAGCVGFAFVLVQRRREA
ncbi:PEP-CTERM sorting domain-containing protein [Coraliomargarita parva]|uniref:PEP-CTERM sorting domain-containing protein n=1 Tax=Coraliomargarita parva TaxID=3014050 RepID=UPI0022B4409C|nr:PEP-CTERM sorting domain-containing protein [Coraliomargarita parva]